MLVIALTFSAEANSLEEIGGERGGFIKVGGFRPASIPFAYIDKNTNKHVGFSVDMADILARNLSRRFGKKIKVVPVGVKSNERIPFVLSGKIDVEMGGSTTHTAKRDEVVDFSLIYFISETTFLTRKTSGISTLTDLYDKKIAITKGTSTLEQILKFVGKGFFKKENLYTVNSFVEAMDAVRSGKVDVITTDRSILEGLKGGAEADSDEWVLLDAAIGYDPYAFMLRENESDLRDFINNTIRWSVQTGEFYKVYDKWMGEHGVTPLKMSPALKEYLSVIAIPMSEDWYKK